MNEKRPGLVQGLGPSAAMAMVVGHIIGTGVFLVPSAMTRATGSVGLVFLVRNWQETKKSFFVQLGGLALIVVGSLLTGMGANPGH